MREKIKLMYKNIRKLPEILLQLLYPSRCPVCDEIVSPFGEKICSECIPKLKIISPPWCVKCGKKLKKDESLCIDCKNKSHEFLRGRSLYEYESAALSIYRFKYGDRPEYADYYASQIKEYLGSFLEKVKPDMLVPIPLHKKRYIKRGYNQAMVLAKAISGQTGIPVNNKVLKRIKNTTAMKMLTPGQRSDNIKNAFIISGNVVKLKTIIIIDDIYTTGTTIDEAARVLKEAGAREIYFLTLAGGRTL